MPVIARATRVGHDAVVTERTGGRLRANQVVRCCTPADSMLPSREGGRDRRLVAGVVARDAQRCHMGPRFVVTDLAVTLVFSELLGWSQVSRAVRRNSGRDFGRTRGHTTPFRLARGALVRRNGRFEQAGGCVLDS